MLGKKTTITRTSQRKEELPVQRVKTETVSQNKISNRTLTQQGNQNSPYKITIKTVYERGFSDQKKNKNEERNLTEKTDDKNNQRKHYHILTAEERKKFSRGIRPSAAQREAEAYAKLSQEQKDNMIEIIDLTKNPANENNEIKLMPNKKTIINKKKVLNHDIRKKPPRGLRPSAADREAEEVKKNQEKYGQIKIEEIITNSDNRINPTITISGSSQSNTTKIISNQPDSQRTQSNSSLNKPSQDFKLLPNKKKIIINPKYKNSAPTTEPSITIRNLPNNNNYNQKKNLTKKVERTYEKPKNEKGIRHNTVSHSIIELRRSPRKPYVLNQRKTDTIKYAPRGPRRYNDSIVGDIDKPYEGNDNHSISITVIRNDTKDDKKAPNKLNNIRNLKNTVSHSIDATKKEPKKEVQIHPRKVLVIRSVIPRRTNKNYDVNKDKDKNENKEDIKIRNYNKVNDNDKRTTLNKKIDRV